MKNRNIEILDCTLRDGGYYNNWNFNQNLIQDYLLAIAKTNIRYVELCFRFSEKDRIKGPTAYTTEKLINSLRIPKDLLIGVMVNAGDLLTNNSSALKNCKKIFENLKKSKIKFVRFACHYEEVFLLKDCIRWLKENDVLVCINIMQISEINKTKIKKVCNFLKKTEVDVLYMADSLGSLTSKSTRSIANQFRKNWNLDLGLHAHNNLKLAKNNALVANKNGVRWIDCTLTGMGRGPGNLKTEDILKTLNISKEMKKFIDKIIKKHFLLLKKRYKWGPNKFYALAAKNRIHPTYIQKLISDKRYKESDYLNIINFLKKTGAKKFNPYKLINSSYFLSSSPKGKWNPKKILKNKNILIVGSGDSVQKNKNKIQNFVLKNNLFVICLNTTSSIEEKLVDLRVACHPMRILSDIEFHKKAASKLVIPFSMMSKKIRNSITIKKGSILDYGMFLKYGDNINIKSNYCVLPYPLAVGYSLSVALAGDVKKIYFAGFDGYKIEDPDKDNTNEILEFFRKKYFKKKLPTLTTSNYRSSLRLFKN